MSSKLDPFREYLLQRLLQDHVTNAAVLFDEIHERGYTGGRSILWEFLHPLRELLADRVTVRVETAPGKQGQVDWGTFRKPGLTRVQAFVLTLGWSRPSYLDFSETQALPALLRCHEHAFHYLGGVPEEILYDRMKTVWLRNDHRGDPVFHPGLLDFAGLLADGRGTLEQASAADADPPALGSLRQVQNACWKSGLDTGPLCGWSAMLGNPETRPPKSGIRTALWWMEGKTELIPETGLPTSSGKEAF